jgi:hypothetical protein
VRKKGEENNHEAGGGVSGYGRPRGVEGPHILREAGEIGAAHGTFRMSRAKRVKACRSLVNFRIRERNGAFGRAARVGERGAERTDQKEEWSGGFGNSSREPQRGSQVLPGLAA